MSDQNPPNTQLTPAEKAVFGQTATKDPVTGRIIEEGHGAIKTFVEGAEAAFDHGPLIDRLAVLETENLQLSNQVAAEANLTAQKDAALQDALAKLADADKPVTALQEQLDAANAQVADLTAKLAAANTPKETPANPAEGL